MVDELGLVSLIDALIIQDHEQRQVSVGQCVKAMILNGLGFVNRALYLMPHYFKDKPVDRLVGEGIQAEHLNDDVLGRALDAIYAYGTSELYGQLAFQTVNRLGVSCRVGHLDSTSFHVDGVYNSIQEEAEAGVIHITQGYSRDHRPDLNQVVLQLITEHQTGIPLWMEALDGNSSDKSQFCETIKTHVKYLHEQVGLHLLVADSALYTAETLQELSQFLWITRVPETIRGVQALCLSVSDDWMNTRPEQAFVELGANYGGVNQRWLVVYTRAAHERAEHTVNRQHLKQSKSDCQTFTTLSKQLFACAADAQQALAYVQKKLQVTTLIEPKIIEVAQFKGKGRPRKNQTPGTVGYRIEAGIASLIETKLRKVQQKCCFIIATNALDKTQFNNDELLAYYTPGQQKVERGFRFLKDPWFMANTLFLKSPKRIMALMVIMTLCLLVYSALEYRIRQTLVQHQKTFPSQSGSVTAKPSARWVFQFFAGIHLLLINDIQRIVLNCNAPHLMLLKLLGERYCKIYSNSG